MPSDPTALTALPAPHDLYAWDGAVDPACPLTPFQETLLAAALPGKARILDVQPHRHWDGRLTFPVHVRVQHVGQAGGQPLEELEQTVLLRMERFRGGVETEAHVLPVLGRLGLPVPRLLAGPAVDPEHPDHGAVSVLTLLPGTDLQHLSFPAPPERVAALGALLFKGVRRLHQETLAVRTDPVGGAVPTVTLEAELQAIQARGGPWLDDDQFRDALTSLLPRAALAGERTPLLFSNGDYNAGNFLATGTDTTGWRLTGIVDFARARFEDPYYGFAKYWVYDMQPFLSAGVIARGLAAWGVTGPPLALRVAIRCLWTLQREVPAAGHDARVGRYRGQLRQLLQRSLVEMKEA